MNGACVAVDSEPFDLGRDAGSRSQAAALCLHGLTGTPYEVRPVAEALARRGLRARGPALAGHNSTPEALAEVGHQAWLDGVADETEKLRAEHERVFAVGMSLGGLLSLSLAARGAVDAVVSIGAPLELAAPIRWLVPVVRHFVAFAPKRGGSDIRDEAARSRHPSHAVMPLASVYELMRLQRRVVRALPSIRVPILVAHGAHDSTAKPEDAERIVASVSSSSSELLLLQNSAHVVPVDFDGPRLSEAVADFLLRQI